MGEFKGTAPSDEEQRLAENLADLDCASTVRVIPRNEIQVDIEMANADWGMPNDLENLLKAASACVMDFSHVTEDDIRLYIMQR